MIIKAETLEEAHKKSVVMFCPYKRGEDNWCDGKDCFAWEYLEGGDDVVSSSFAFCKRVENHD